MRFSYTKFDFYIFGCICSPSPIHLRLILTFSRFFLIYDLFYSPELYVGTSGMQNSAFWGFCFFMFYVGRDLLPPILQKKNIVWIMAIIKANNDNSDIGTKLFEKKCVFCWWVWLKKDGNWCNIKNILNIVAFNFKLIL